MGMSSADQNPFSDPWEHLLRAPRADNALNPSPQHITDNDQCVTNLFGQIHMEQPSLGLTLRKTPSFLELIQNSVNHTNVPNIASKPNDGSLCKAKQILYDDKVKASNLNALFLKIGSWQRESKHEGDLVAKCYFAKRKMVWEFLENALKRKIEIDWSDILAMRATTKANELGVLEIELNKPPNFYNELDPQPRRHTQWQTTSDFTGGQAQIYRRHYLLFLPGTLDKHYEKLVQYESKFFQMSQKGFPSLHSPYFQRSFQALDFSLPPPFVDQNFHQNRPFLSQHYHHLNKQATQPYLNLQDSSSPDSVMEFWGQKDNHAVKRQRTTFWGQHGMCRDDHNNYGGGTISRTLANQPLPLAYIEAQPSLSPELDIQQLGVNFAGNLVMHHQTAATSGLTTLDPAVCFTNNECLQQVSFDLTAQMNNKNVPTLMGMAEGGENDFSNQVNYEQGSLSWCPSLFNDQSMESFDSTDCG